MPIATCNISSWSNNAAFTFDNIGPKRTKAFKVFALAAQLNNLGGGDYRNASDLARASSSIRRLSSNRIEAALLGVAIRNANAVTSGSVPTDPSLLANSAKTFVAQPDHILDQEILFLTCNLGFNTGA